MRERGQATMRTDARFPRLGAWDASAIAITRRPVRGRIRKLEKLMAFGPGARLGPFEVVSVIGAGGMGEVYQARDTRLKREVALKILPASFATDPDRLARFQREAEVLATLNHPHIAAIYGLEESDGTRALVIELVEGETLADRIARGAIPIDDALPIAKQIAEALEAAHEQGIIHRDLKPANIKVRPDGTVKVLDFGLAKLNDPNVQNGPNDPNGPNVLSMSPTITSPALMTGVGVLLGTAAYMSPEQARGKPADKRSDIWAFGCVLYEMLTGKRAFAGHDVSETLAGVIKSEPDWHELPKDVPSSIHRLLRRCLKKDRQLRVGDLSIARIEIDDARDGSGDAASEIPTRSRSRVHLMWAAAAGLAAATAGVFAWALRAVPPPAEMRLAIETPPAMDSTSVAISPDGDKVVFEAISEGRPRLWLRSLSSSTARPLARTEEAYLPFWSPDGRSVGFFAAGKLKRIDLNGETVQTLADAGVAGGGAWNRDGVILFVPNKIIGLARVAASGGASAEVLNFGAKQGLRQLSHPQFLPDGGHFVFASEGRGGGIVEIYAGALDGSEPRHLLDTDNGNTEIAYAADHLFFIRQGTLFAQRLDLTRLTVIGDPTPVAEGVGVIAAATSPETPTLVYRPAASAPRARQLVWVDRAGITIGKLGEPYAAGAGNPSMSPDGGTVAVAQVTQGNSDIWLVDSRRGLFSRFTSDPFISNNAVWSPDGSRIVFQSNPKVALDLYQQRLSGDRTEELVLATPESKMPTDWRGDFLLYHTYAARTGTDLWALPMKGERKPFPLLQTPYDERIGEFSRDGHWIAYQSNESGQDEIYVRPFPGSGPSTRVSTRGGGQARWREDGKELFYIARDDRLMAVPMRLEPDGRSVEPGIPVPLFATHVGGALQQFMTAPTRQQYMVSRDGSRFLMNNLVEQESTTSPITVVLNWKGKP